MSHSNDLESQQEQWNRLITIQMNNHPDTKALANLLANEGHKVTVDHIALRSVVTREYDFLSLIGDFIDCTPLAEGYTIGDSYFFKDKNVKAVHLNPPDPSLPKIFFSTLEQELLSEQGRDIIDNLQYGVFSLMSRPYSPRYSEYKVLQQESEYAAWVYANGFIPNHVAFSLNGTDLPIERFTNTPEMNGLGFYFNSVGGDIKGSKDVLLQQTSTVATSTMTSFVEGFFPVPGCFVEFILRHKDKNGNLFQGFVEGNADKIFHSTDSARSNMG